MKRMYAVDANRIFLLSVAVSQMMMYLFAGAGVRDRMLLQFLVEVFMVLPGILYLVMQGRSVKESFPVKPLTWKTWLLLIPFVVCVDKIAEFINVVSQLFSTNMVGSHMAELIMQYPFPVAFFVIAVTPAICEEWVFRGMLSHGYRKTNVGISIVLTAFLFGIMHMNLNQFSYAFVLGLVFALINEVTGSVLPSVFMHLYINGRSVVVLFFSVNYLTGLREQYVAAEAANDIGKMEQLLADAQGVPIDSASWLQDYMSMGSSSVTEMIQELLPGVLIATGCALILFFFIRLCNGWKGKGCKPVEGMEVKKEAGENGNRSPIVSAELIVGILICIVCMIWE